MKKLPAIILIGLTGLISWSCVKNAHDLGDCHCDGVSATVVVSGIDHTRALASAVNDTKVNDLQVLVFRADGRLDGYAFASSDNVEVKCTMGDRTFVAVVNGPDMSGVAEYSGVKAALASWKLQSNGVESLIMAGEKSQTISGNSTVAVSVTRRVAQLGISKISTDWASEAWKASTFKVTDIFVTNASGQLDASGNVVLWCNRMTDCGDAPALLHDSVGQTLADGASYTQEHRFYTYANPTSADSHDKTSWCARHTRIVVKAELGGKVMYYPLTFGQIEANKTYMVTGLKITRPGVDHPEDPIDSQTVTGTVTIVDWSTGETIEETI